MKVICDQCGEVFNKKPSALRKLNFCDKECRRKYHNRDLICPVCHKSFVRATCSLSKINFCSIECTKVFTSQRMTDMNEALNPSRMTPSTRKKLREAGIKEGAKSYPKLYGKHEHRVVAAKKLGRSLKKGEVVHHIDGDKRNNNPINLMVFKSQAEHAKWHYNEIHNPEANYGKITK